MPFIRVHSKTIHKGGLQSFGKLFLNAINNDNKPFEYLIPESSIKFIINDVQGIYNSKIVFLDNSSLDVIETVKEISDQ